MAARHRYLAALVVNGELAVEIDGMRRALGSHDLDRIRAHVTLVAPTNVQDDAVHDVVEHVRSVASTFSPITVSLGPARGFADRSDVVFLALDGEVNELCRLAEALSFGPLAPPASRKARSFVPHVTLSTHLERARHDAALVALADYKARYTFESVALMEQDPTHTAHPWHVVATFELAPRVVVGRGGRELEFSFAEVPDPDAARFFRNAWTRYLEQTYDDATRPGEAFALVVRDNGRVVGVATGTTSQTLWVLDRLVVDETRRGEGIGGQLLSYLERVVVDRGGTRIRLVTAASGTARSLYASRGYVVVAEVPRFRGDVTFVAMERALV